MSNEVKVCPYCGEEINLKAIKCKHCKTMLSEDGSQNDTHEILSEKASRVTSKWGYGAIIIIASAIIALMSMFMKWVDIGFAYQTGFQQGTVILLLLWIYPVFMAVKQTPISKFWGVLMAVASVVATIAYMASKQVDVFGEQLLLAGTGAWLYLFVSIALFVGVLLYKQPANSSFENQPGRSIWQLWWAWLLLIGIILVVLVIAFGGNDHAELDPPFTTNENSSYSADTPQEPSGVPPGHMSAGTYLVGTDIEPGR